MKENEFRTNGKRYILVPDENADGSECSRCALQKHCHENCADGLCQDLFGIDEARDKRFEEAPSDDVLTEEKVYDFYQKCSVKAGDRADQLAWMFIVMMTGGLISGHAFQTFSICAALAAIYMLLSVTQSVWQTFTAWLFKNQVKKMGVAPDDYPSWVGGGAWFFFLAKMITIASAVIYFAKAIFY